MFANIHKSADFQLLQQRLNKLHAESLRRWGTMNSAEMLFHLRAQLEASLGIIETPPLYKNWAQKQPFTWLYLYPLPWPRGFKTAKAFNAKKQSAFVKDFETEKQLYLQRLSEFKACTSPNYHPLFGALSVKDWGRLVYKHTDYHLRQFGA